MPNPIKSSVWVITPDDPVSPSQAGNLREKLQEDLDRLTSVAQALLNEPALAGDEEEEVIVITSPPPS